MSSLRDMAQEAPAQVGAVQYDATPERRPQVWEEMDRLMFLMDDLESRYSTLSERLEPVRLHTPESPLAEKVPETIKSELADRLAALGDRMGAVGDALAYLTRTLEV